MQGAVPRGPIEIALERLKNPLRGFVEYVCKTDRRAAREWNLEYVRNAAPDTLIRDIVMNWESVFRNYLPRQEITSRYYDRRDMTHACRGWINELHFIRNKALHLDDAFEPTRDSVIFLWVASRLLEELNRKDDARELTERRLEIERRMSHSNPTFLPFPITDPDQPEFQQFRYLLHDRFDPEVRDTDEDLRRWLAASSNPESQCQDYFMVAKFDG